MNYDKDKVDDAVLALLCLTMHNGGTATRAWKGNDWAAMDRLHQKGYISDPKGMTRSVVMTDEGKVREEQMFRQQMASPELCRVLPSKTL
jgi:hypothetical protein